MRLHPFCFCGAYGDDGERVLDVCHVYHAYGDDAFLQQSPNHTGGLYTKGCGKAHHSNHRRLGSRENPKENQCLDKDIRPKLSRDHCSTERLLGLCKGSRKDFGQGTKRLGSFGHPIEEHSEFLVKTFILIL